MRPELPKTLLKKLSEGAIAAGVKRATPLSGGRTNQVWRLDTDAGSFIVKLFSDRNENPLFPNDPDAEAAVLEHLDGFDFAPALVSKGSSDDGRWLVYAFVEGAPWNSDSFAVGRQLRQLHSCPGLAGLRDAPNGSDALISQTEKLLSSCPEPDAAALYAARPDGPNVPRTAPRLIHGDPVPANILVSGERVTLIDWQCPAMGDPCEDLAIFLSPAMQLIYGGAPLSDDDERRFLQGYGDPDLIARYRDLRQLFHWRMAAYCLWRVGQGDVAYQAGLDLERIALKASS